MNKLEILAPAGDWKSLECAIYNGADAVYLGLSNFNARIKADNFDEDNIARAVEFAHLFGVKVYVTINTLVKDNEVECFLSMVERAVEARVDACIIQDLGMAMLLKRKFPNIVLHASTQMGIHNLKGARILEKLGFCRVVLSRETKLKDIVDIKQNTNLEIEYFVQGALCVAFSGNCYLSAIKNGNSGNRGKCLQLCRLPYTLYRNNKKLGQGYFLSPKDLCLMKNLVKLIEVGVTSFKIEGRLKRPSYVVQTVRSYRKALDSILDNSSLDIPKEEAKIKEIFSRGEFNENAYLYDNFNIINKDINNHEGKLIGKVIKVEKFKDLQKITLNLSEKIAFGDAIRLINDDKIISIGVGNVNVMQNGKYEIFSTQKPESNARVYLLKSEEKEARLTEYVKKLPVDFYFFGKVGKLPKLEAKYKDISVEVEGEEILTTAKTKPCTFEDIYKQISKLNDTHFVINTLEVDIDEVFAPVSILNDLRRRVIGKLQNEIINEYNNGLKEVVINEIDIDLPKLKLERKNYVMIDENTIFTSYSDHDVIICPREYTRENIDKLVSKVIKQGYDYNSIYLDLPIVSTREELEIIEEIVKDAKFGLVINNYSGLSFVKTHRVIAGLGMNVYNSFTAKAFLDMGVTNFVRSIECDNFGNFAGITYANGYPNLMTLTHCPIRECIGGNCGECRYTDTVTIEDEKKNIYKYRRIKIKHCYFGLISLEKIERNVKSSKIIDLRGE